MTNFRWYVVQLFVLSVIAVSCTGQATTVDQAATSSPATTPGQAIPAGQATTGQTDTRQVTPSPDTNAVSLALALSAGKPPQVCVDKINRGENVLGLNGDQFCPLYLILTSRQYQAASRYVRNQAFAQAFTQLQKRVDTVLANEVKKISGQTGSSSGTGGSTNLTSKGIAAKFLSVASEYGALTESTSGQTTTVNGTLAGVPVALMKKGIAEECSTKLLAETPCFHHAVVDYMNRISYSLSYDTSQAGQTISGTAVGSSTGTAQEVKATGNSHSISAVSAKWVIIQGKSSSKDIQDALTNLTKGQTVAAKASEAAVNLQNSELTSQTFQDWYQKMATKLGDDMAGDKSGKKALADWSKMGTCLVWTLDSTLTPNVGDACLGDQFVQFKPDVDGQKAANSVVIKNAIQLAIDYSAYLGAEEDAAIPIAKPAYLTFEYDENRPANQPTNSIFRGIFQHKIGQEASITFNGAISIYDSAPSSSIPGASRLRDAQFAVETDEPFSLNTAFTGKVGMTLSEAFYFQNQTSPAILNVNPGSPVNGVSFTGLPANATQIFAQKGNIGVGQIKLSIGSGSNLKVPLSVTYSNRTELIVKPTWRAQIGVSYDLDSLFQGK
jgi:hypothetical protein